MKKFLIKSTAGLFALSLLIAPMMVFAATAVNPPDTCTLRSTVKFEDLMTLTAAKEVDLKGGLPSSAWDLGSGDVIPYIGALAPADPPTLPLDKRKTAINENFAFICTFSLVSWVSNIIFLAIGTLAVLVIALSALFFVTAAGSEDRLKKAKAYLLYGAVGIAVAALANLIPAIVKGFFGAG